MKEPGDEAEGEAPNARQLQKARTREALLAAARKVLRKRGFAKTTTREVAREAGVAAGTVFVHFRDVDALVEALLDEHIAAALEGARRTMPKGGDLVARLVHVSKKLYDSYAAEPELSREYLSASLFRAEAGGPADQRLADFQAWVSTEIMEAVSAGRCPPIDLRLAFGAFFSLYFGVLVAGLRGQLTRKDQLALLDASLRRLFNLEVTP